MAETADQITNALERIRDDAQRALSLLGGSEDQRALSWKCAACGHVNRLTSFCSSWLTLIHVSFHRQIDRLAGAALLLNLAQFCSNYGVEYTKAV
jgi:hypothetical protein